MKLQQLQVSDWIDMTDDTRQRILAVLGGLDPKAPVTSVAIRLPAPAQAVPLPQVRIVLDAADLIGLLSDR